METNEKLMDEKINPSDIIFEAESDEDMPMPETNNYDAEHKSAEDEKYLKPTYKFMELFHDCLGKMPYAAVIKNANNEQIKLIDLVRFVEVKHEKMSVKEMNTIIGFIAQCPLEFVRPLMEIIEDSKHQVELWQLI